MVHVLVSVDIPAPPDDVWRAIADISTHVEWMADAEEIRFLTDQRSGVGTTFECATRIGPFATTDNMTVTHWQPGHSMAVTHHGLFSGDGVFRLVPQADGRSTRFFWREEVHFPWFFGGKIGGTVAKPILAAVWRGNLRRLQQTVATSSPASG